MRPRGLPLVVLFGALVAPAARAGERTYAGIGVAAQTVPEPMLGESRDVTKGLGLSPRDLDTSWVVPQLAYGFDLDEHTGIDVQAAWLADAHEAYGSTPISYRVRRDVVPVSAMFRVMSRRRALQTMFDVGPMLGVTRFAERGWLGDGTSWNVAYGASARLAFRTDGEQVRFVFGLGLTWMHLPTTNPLVKDGGSAVTGGLTTGLEFGL